MGWGGRGKEQHFSKNRKGRTENRNKHSSSERTPSKRDSEKTQSKQTLLKIHALKLKPRALQLL